jgi:hypothetical protein
VRVRCWQGYAGHGRGQRFGNLLAFAARLPGGLVMAAVTAAVGHVSIVFAPAASWRHRRAGRRLRRGIMTGAEQLQMPVSAVTRGGRQTAEDRQENHPRDDCGPQLSATRWHRTDLGKRRNKLAVSYVIGRCCQLRSVQACTCLVAAQHLGISQNKYARLAVWFARRLVGQRIGSAVVIVGAELNALTGKWPVCRW